MIIEQECPSCGEIGPCRHLIAIVDIKFGRVAEGILKKRIEDQISGKTENGQDIRAVIREVTNKLSRVCEADMQKRSVYRDRECYWFWSQNIKEAAERYFAKERVLKPRRDEIKYEPINEDAYEIVTPTPLEDLISEKELADMEREKRRVKAEEIGYPNWAQYFYANGILEQFLE